MPPAQAPTVAFVDGAGASAAAAQLPQIVRRGSEECLSGDDRIRARLSHKPGSRGGRFSGIGLGSGVVAIYREHASKPARLRGGELVVYEDATHEDCTVWVFHERDSEGEEHWEGLLARRLPEERARICAVPVFVYDLNLGDEVSVAASAEGAAVATGLISDAGNFTFRVFFEHGVANDDEGWRALMADLEPFNCWFDVYSPRLVALSATSSHAADVADYLAERVARGELHYETGRSSEPHRGG